MTEMPHRLDGFDPTEVLEELRTLTSGELGPAGERRIDWNLGDWHQAGTLTKSERMAGLFSLLDHWMMLGCDPPAEWRWPAPELAGAAIRVQRNQPKRTTRAERQHGS
jgi:hypothetical protein